MKQKLALSVQFLYDFYSPFIKQSMKTNKQFRPLSFQEWLWVVVIGLVSVPVVRNLALYILGI